MRIAADFVGRAGGAAPEHATVAKGQKMLNDIADAIAKEATEIFRMLEEAQGGTAEIKHLKVAG